jgi:acyl-CoA dehydrogenase
MLTLGGKLKHKEHISGRLGDVLSQLYICSAMLKRYELQGRPAADQPILAWAFHDATFKIQTALETMIDNFPNRVVRILLSLVVFPLGRHEKQPGDRLGHKVAQLLLSPSETRDRLTMGAYIPQDISNPIGILEAALPRVIACEPVERRILKALRAGQLDEANWKNHLDEALSKSIITAVEAKELKEVRAMVEEIIAVDDFDQSEIQLGVAAKGHKKATDKAA